MATPAADPPVRVVVVGGGIAGLAAAHSLVQRAPHLDVCLLEGSPYVGGKLRLGEVADQQVDLGPEALLARRPEAVDLAHRVGLGADLVSPATTGAGVWTRGAVRPLPPSLMGIPADLAAAVASGVLTRAEADRAAAEWDLPPLALADDIGIGRLVADRLGPAVRDRLVEPLLGGVYAGNADDISVQAAVPQLVSGVREHGHLLAAAAASASAPAETGEEPKPPVFTGITGGVGRLAAAVAADIERRGGRIRTNSIVRRMERTPDGWRLVLGPAPAPETVDADAVVLAVPATPAARLLSPLAPDAAAALAGIGYASMAVVTLAFDVPVSGAGLRGTGFLVPPVDGRTIKAATFSSMKWGWLTRGRLVLRCSIGRYGEPHQLQREDAELVDTAVTEVREATGLAATLLDSHVMRWGGALPQYTVGHRDRVARVRAAVAALPGVAVCGAAYDGIGVPACIGTGERAADQVLGWLGSRATMET